MTEPEPLQQIDRTCVRFGGRKLSYFSGCDYFRLASHPEVVAALHEGARKFGLNVAASRLTTGNHALYGKLERAIADFFEAQDVLITSTGYMTNLVVAQALAGNFSHILLDENCHQSLSDAARFFDCPVLRFKHRDSEDVARAVRRCGPAASVILLSDGMFARDGSVAPLLEYLRVLPTDAWMLVDDAHGAGVLGPTGKGSLEHAGLPRRRIIQTVTLSKAFGAYGGAILGTSKLRQRILDRSRMFVGSTPFPLPLANAALRGVQLLKTDPSLRQRLTANGAYIRRSLGDAGVPIPVLSGPIISIFLKTTNAIAQLNTRLLRAGIYPPFLQYPGGPERGFFRFVISSEHSRKQLNNLIAALACPALFSRDNAIRSR